MFEDLNVWLFECSCLWIADLKQIVLCIKQKTSFVMNGQIQSGENLYETVSPLATVCPFSHRIKTIGWLYSQKEKHGANNK
jgi:hypothetical protein